MVSLSRYIDKLMLLEGHASGMSALDTYWVADISVQHTSVTRRTQRSHLLSGVGSDINPFSSAPSSPALRSEVSDV